VDGGLLHSTDPVLRICPECAASLSRWLERGRRRAASPGPMVQEPKDANDQPRHRKHRSREEVRRHRDRKALLMNAIHRSACLLVVCFPFVSRADVRLDLSTATLTLNDRGVVTALAFPDGTSWPGLKQPVFALETASGTVFPKIVKVEHL